MWSECGIDVEPPGGQEARAGCYDVSMMLSGAGAWAGATEAPTGAALAATKAKRDAWAAYRGIRRRDAMRKFVELLDDKVKGWADTAAGMSGGK
jgi:hypothetical protein